jgi:2-hydroxy-6-oxonona-2,4-dienedioate hydrolase
LPPGTVAAQGVRVTTTARDLLPPEGTSHTVQGAEGPVGYLDIGTGDPVLLVHAFGPMPGTTAWLIWRETIAVLSRTRRCIAVELPNYGFTGPVVYEEPVHDVAVRAVVTVLDHLGIASVPAVGTSMGATVCLDLALTHPERVERLVLGACHASTGGDPYLLAPWPSEVMKLHIESQADPGDRDKLERLMRAIVFDQDIVSPALLDSMLELRAGHMDHWEAGAKSVSVEHSNVTSLKALTVPVLVIHGRFDRMVPFEQALMIISHVPQADVVILNACGHWPPLERPDAFVPLVARFLGSSIS